MFTTAFVEDRRRHLLARLAKVKQRAGSPDMPEEHRRWKVETLIPDIRAALQRINDGLYGHCVCCNNNKPIDKKRLLILPESARCAECQEQQEQEEAAHARRATG